MESLRRGSCKYAPFCYFKRALSNLTKYRLPNSVRVQADRHDYVVANLQRAAAAPKYKISSLPALAARDFQVGLI